MSNIGSSNLYSASSGASGNGISGLMSGMDTDAMVEKMLSGTQSKIDKQEALKQQNVWKQEIYRDMISSINGFYGKYFDSRFGASSVNNLASANFFNTMISAVTRGNALRVVSSNPGAAAGDLKVAVKELASSSSMKSDVKMSTGRTIEGETMTKEALKANFEKTLTLMIDDDMLKFDFSGAETTEDVANIMNAKFADEGKSITAKVFDGKLRLISSNPNTKMALVTNLSSELGLQMTGFSALSSVPITDVDGTVIGKMLQGGEMNPSAAYTFSMSLDGVAKTISLKDVANPDGSITADSIKTALDAEVKRAFGTYVNVNLSGNDTDGYKFGFSLSTTEPGHELIVSDMNVGRLGIVPGSSTCVNSATKLKDLGAMGDKYSFTINGREFSFTGDDSVGTVINKVNASDAGVRLTFSSISDSFKMETTSSGAEYGIDLTQTEGNLLGVMFGDDKVNAASKASSKTMRTNNITGTAIAADYTTKSTSLSINVNGSSYTFSMLEDPDDKDKVYTKTDIEKEFNTWLKKNFGTEDKDDPTSPAKITYADGKLNIAKGLTVSFSQTKIDMDDPKAVEEAMKSDLGFVMGFNKKAVSNVANADSKIEDIYELKDIASMLTTSSGAAATKLGDIAYVGSQAVSVNDGRFTVTGSSTVNLGPELTELFGTNELKLSDGKLDSGAVAAGRDAVVIINGEETTRSGNNITIDGVTIELTAVSKEILDSSGVGTGKYEETVVSTSRDVDSIVDGFKSFVEDYNKMIEKLNGYVDEKSTYRDYAPLTAAQKKDMSDKEIELWEKNAKEGLIRGDSSTNQFLSEMRLALYSKPAGSKYALYNIGIETTKDYKAKGKLELDETALRNAIAADPDAVKNLFTDATEGISKKLMDSMDRAAKESSGSPGALVQMAGTKQVMDKKNNLYDRITTIESRIKDLKVKYERERTRYWNQFSRMESVLASFNQQSAMLTNQFSGY